jgi:hypothetical protein
MKRIALILLVFLATTSCMAQSHKLPWKEGSKLTWTDFSGKADLSSDFWAYTGYIFGYTIRGDEDDKITVELNCYFDKSRSWKKPEKKLTPEILVHEQGHFDLAEFYGRRMRRAFAEYAATHKYSDKASAEIEAIFNKMNAECQALQDKYDSETDHSKVTEKQEEWNKKIPEMLARLSEYKK